jgi:serine/threonine protein kinase
MAVNMAEPTNLTGEPAQPAPAPALTPEEIAPFFPQLEIIEFLGRGGMGAVYKARQPRLDRLVALKILAPEREQDPAFASRFEKEAQALARLSHPNIVTIHDFGETSGMYYLLMEYVDGVTLRQLLDAGRVSPREALAIVPQICDALQFAHDRGIVHRDIKPENLLMDRLGRVKVADFGLAKLVGAAPDFSADAGKVLGTPSYMAPEQTEDPGAVDHRADIYALGVVFYQMLTGELPGQRIEAPSSKVHIDVRLDEVVLRALAANPEMRYQQASLLKTQLETIAGEPAPVEAARSLPTAAGSVAAAPLPTKPRLSRLAIVGACLIGLSLCTIPPALLIGLIFFRSVRTVSAYELQQQQQIAQQRAEALRYQQAWEQQQMRPSGTVPILPNFAPVFRGPVQPSGGGISIIGILILLALLALLVPATVLGWVAVVQIRRSGGAIYGMRLALFDGLFFPVLVFSGLLLVGLTPVTHGGMIPVFSILLVPVLVGAMAALAIRWATWKTPAASTQKRSRWKNWLIFALGMTVFCVSIYEDRKNQEPELVWVPSGIDASVSGKFGEALVHVTAVSQVGQIVIITLACDTSFTGGGLNVQYSGQTSGFSQAYNGDLGAGPLDCLMSPHFMSHQDDGQLIEGNSLLRGKRIYRIGFMLPDAAAAAKTVQQVQQVHLGKPRGLDQATPSLLLFSLHKLVGEKPDGQPNHEALMGMLMWQAAWPPDAGSAQASANEAFGPAKGCSLAMDETGMTPLFDPDLNQPVPGTQPGDNAEKMAALRLPGIAIRHDESGHKIVFYGMSGALVSQMPPPPGPGYPWERMTASLASMALSGNTMSPGGYISVEAPDDLPQTFYFKSGAGLLGALEITGFGTTPRIVSLRFKMAPHATWNGNANPTPPSAGPAFGPATEFALPMDQTGLTQLFYLDLAQPAPGAMPGDTAEKMAARGHTGIAVRHDAAGHKIVLYGMSGSLVSLIPHPSGSDDPWEQLTAPQAFTALLKNTMSQGGYVSVEAPDDLPETFYFKTSHGLLGVLQITNFGSNGPDRNQLCVYLRYKMVMHATWRDGAK